MKEIRSNYGMIWITNYYSETDIGDCHHLDRSDSFIVA